MGELSTRQAEVMAMIKSNLTSYGSAYVPVKYRVTVNSLINRGLIKVTGVEIAGMITVGLVEAEATPVAEDVPTLEITAIGGRMGGLAQGQSLTDDSGTVWTIADFGDHGVILVNANGIRTDRSFSETQGWLDNAMAALTAEDVCTLCGRSDTLGRDDQVTPFPHECVTATQAEAGMFVRTDNVAEVSPAELPGVGQWIMWQGFSYMVEARYSDGRMNLKPYGGYECVIPDRPIAQLMAWGEVKWPTHACVNCGPRSSAWCTKCYLCDHWGRPLVAERVFSDRDLRDEVVAYLGDLVNDFYVDGIVDSVIKANNGAVSIDSISEAEWSRLIMAHHKRTVPTVEIHTDSAVITKADVVDRFKVAFTPTEEEIIWARTYTMIKPTIRTKLAKRSRKSARRARRGIKGGM